MLKKSKSLIITAAGQGIRFGYPEGKVFVPIQDKPLIVHTIERLFQYDKYQQVILTIQEKQVQHLQGCLIKHDLNTGYQVIAGGKTRQQSVKLAFEKLDPVDTVIIHDGVRPNFSSELLNRLLSAAEQHPAVIPGVAMSDTIKQITTDSFVQNTIPREKLVAVQTPQLFDYQVLKKIYAQPEQNTVTDEAALCEAQGIPIKVVSGELTNIKLTFPQDLDLLQFYWKSFSSSGNR